MDSVIVTSVSVISTIIVISVRKNKLRKRKRNIWCKLWHIIYRKDQSMFNMLHKELSLQDPIAYQNSPRLNREQFDNLLKLIEPIITGMFIFIINRFHNI